METLGTLPTLPSNLTIPTLPAIVRRINQLIDDPRTGTREIGKVLATDAPLAAKVLRVANSAFYGLAEPCVSAEQAAAVLGVRVLRNVAMQASVIRRFEHLRKTGFDLDGLWQHSVLTAQACAELARCCRNVHDLSPDEFYSCGLLHDLGKVVMLDSLGEPYAEIVDRSRLCAEPLQVIEQRELGYDHTAVGAVIASRWGLPEPVAAAIRYHHGPREAVRDSAVVSLVANANLLVQRVVQGDLARAADVFDASTAAFLGLSAEGVAEVFGYFVEQHTLIEV